MDLVEPIGIFIIFNQFLKINPSTLKLLKAWAKVWLEYENDRKAHLHNF